MSALKADIEASPPDVRFTPKSGNRALVTTRPSLDRRGRCRASNRCRLCRYRPLQVLDFAQRGPPESGHAERDRHAGAVRRKVRRTTAPGQAVSCASFA
jgi:hypothetical protein